MQAKYIEYALEQLETLLNIPSPSGFTMQAAQYCYDVLSELGYKPTFTRKNGVMVTLGGEGEAILLGAHIDTLGAMVREILENGALRVSKIGGLTPANVDTETVTVYTSDANTYYGTFQLENASVHVNSEYAQTVRTFDNLEVLLDEKVKTKADTLKLGIQVGDYVCVNPRFTVTKSGFIKSRFLDDKLSAAILLSFAKYVHDETIILPRKVYLDFTVFEEVGHGAASIPNDITEMIAVDMGCVGKGLQCDETMVSICAMDSRGPSSKVLVDKLVQVSKEEKLQYAIDVYPYYVSDADAALASGYDIRHCTVGAGVYASHGYERSHVEGLSNTFDLLCSYIRKQ